MRRRCQCISSCGMRCHCSTSRRFSLGNLVVGKGYKSHTCGPRIYQNCSIAYISVGLDGPSAVLPTVPGHIASMGSGNVFLRRNLLLKSERSEGHTGERLHPHSAYLYVCHKLQRSWYGELCKVNGP